MLLGVDLVEREIIVQHEERSFGANEERGMAVKVGTVSRVALAYFSAEDGEGEYLPIDREKEFLLASIEIEKREEGVLNAALNSYLLLTHDDLVCLIDRKLVFGYFGDINGLIA